ncbi:MAG: peroxisome- protein [Caeruleum heppii]|nr:MAG: peroxisome- protein [Caeruleum heppii]
MSAHSPRAPDSGSAHNQDLNPPTIASFSPVQTLRVPIATRQRSTILVHQKSPLLIATPPQVTRALAYSHPFILPLSTFAGLLSWTTGDPWASFLLVVSFWLTVLYGDALLRWTGPLLLVACLILGLYFRRYSPLSSSEWAKEKLKDDKKRRSGGQDAGPKHQKSLDEILEALTVFTARCNVLLEPPVRLIDFLAMQRSASTASTRSAITTLFIRFLISSPIWVALTLPPVRMITTKRIIITGNTVAIPNDPLAMLNAYWPGFERPAQQASSRTSRSGIDVAISSQAATNLKGPAGSPGVRFTFILYENQRRWIGLGWTHSLLSYERAAWTDEHLNAMPAKDNFELPEVEGVHARWRWVDGSQWKVEGATTGGDRNVLGDRTSEHEEWRDGRRGSDSWGRYTRRRKWYRDAELVEVTASSEMSPNPSPRPPTSLDGTQPESQEMKSIDPADDTSNDLKKRKWFRGRGKTSARSSIQSFEAGSAEDEGEEHPAIRGRLDRDGDWGVGDDARMGLE